MKYVKFFNENLSALKFLNFADDEKHLEDIFAKQYADCRATELYELRKNLIKKYFDLNLYLQLLMYIEKNGVYVGLEEYPLSEIIVRSRNDRNRETARRFWCYALKQPRGAYTIMRSSWLNFEKRTTNNSASDKKHTEKLFLENKRRLIDILEQYRSDLEWIGDKDEILATESEIDKINQNRPCRKAPKKYIEPENI